MSRPTSRLLNLMRRLGGQGVAKAPPRNRIALLQFHRDEEVCRDRLRLLRRFNPGIRIFGIFGGPEDSYGWAQRLVEDGLEAVYRLEGRTPTWKWKHTDLAVRAWYQAFGHTIDFDAVNVLQWDLLLFQSLATAYGHIPGDSLGLTGLTRLDLIADRWHWTVSEPPKSDWAQLSELVRARFGYRDVPRACLGPGYCLPRAFLDRYAGMDVPELCHDELRLPLFGQLLGFRLHDTGFYPGWFDAAGEAVFNANGDEIDVRVIRAELSRVDGARVFHPFRQVFGDDYAVSGA